MIRSVLCAFAPALLLALACLPAGADYNNGYVEDGYVHYNGYWRHGNNLYTRSWVAPTAGYYHYGYYYPGRAGYWQYYYSHPYSPPAQQRAEYKPFDWKEGLLAIKKQQLDYQEFRQAARDLGIQTGGAGNYQESQYNAAGSSLYGYSVNSTQDFSGPVDVSLAVQAAARLVERTQELTGNATERFQQGVNELSRGQVEVAKIRAKGEALSRLAKELESPHVRIQNSVTQFSTDKSVLGGGVSRPPVEPLPEDVPPGEEPLPQRAPKAVPFSVLARDCIQCHSAKLVKAGKTQFDVMTLPRARAEVKEDVWDRLITEKAARRMPRDRAGNPLELPEDKLRAWQAFLTGQVARQ